MPIVYDPSGYVAPNGASLINRVIDVLAGYTASPSQVTYLTAPVATTDTSVKMAADAEGLGRGVYEIGEELLYVTSFDQGTATCLPQGRGWRGTQVATHAAGDTVTVDPLVPRFRVREALNETITALWPDVFGIGAATLTASTVTVDYALPADCEAVLDVSWLDYHGDYQRVRGWEEENTGTARTLRVTQRVTPGRTIRVVYAKRLTYLTDSGNIADSGLPESALDLVVLGAVMRLLPSLDIGRLNTRAAAPELIGQASPLGGALSIAKDLRAQFEKRLTSERAELRRRFPARVHFTR